MSSAYTTEIFPAREQVDFLRAPGSQAGGATRSKILDLAQASADYVVHEAAHHHFLGNPWMRSQFLQLMPHVFFDVLESVEKGRRDGGGAGAVLDARAQLLLGRMHQAAVRVVDDHEFLGFQ